MPPALTATVLTRDGTTLALAGMILRAAKSPFAPVKTILTRAGAAFAPLKAIHSSAKTRPGGAGPLMSRLAGTPAPPQTAIALSRPPPGLNVH
jgi:hypothetical protein